MPTLEETLASRWKFDGIPGFSAPAKAALTKALDLNVALRAKHAQIAADDKLSPIGKQDAFRKHLAENAHQLVRARKAVDALKAKTAQYLASVQPKAPDKTDFAAAVTRSDYRQMLREMPIGKRMSLLLAPDADPTMLQAVLESPVNELSGINQETRRLVTQNAVERENPGATARIEKIRDAIELAEVATGAAFGTALKTAEFPNQHVFDSFIDQAVGDTTRLSAEVDREISQAA